MTERGASRTAADVALAERSEKPLTPPTGMRDLLPPESRARRRVSAQLTRVFERYGYDLVTTPLFEHVDVFARGITVDDRDLLRFVEPDGGEIVALRPDITPQIARVVATRMSEWPPPYRLHYEGSVIRRRRGRARKQRQITQSGIELIGLAGADADVEVIRLTAEACRAAGLSAYRLELSHVGIGRALLGAHAPAALLARLAEPLARKDEGALEGALAAAGFDVEVRRRILALAHLHGGIDVLDEAARVLAGTPAAAHLAHLGQVVEQLVALGLAPVLGVDLGEIRHFAYYSGVSFTLLAPGPGEAIASGGRYDPLLSRYGASQPATGAGIDVENLLAALDHAGYAWREREAVRFLVVGEAGGAEALAQRLRGFGLATARLPEGSDALAYARAWSYDAVVQREGDALTGIRARDGERRALGAAEAGGQPGPMDIDALVDWARSTHG